MTCQTNNIPQTSFTHQWESSNTALKLGCVTVCVVNASLLTFACAMRHNHNPTYSAGAVSPVLVAWSVTTNNIIIVKAPLKK